MTEPRWRFQAEGIGSAARYAATRSTMELALRDLPLRPGMRVLEVGCGAGGYTEIFMAKLEGRGEWVAVDHDEALLEQARENVGPVGEVALRFEKVDALDLPFADSEFDAVVSAFLLCVLPSPLESLTEMKRVTKPGGVIASISCFCKSGALPLFHGVERWDGMERYAELEPRVRAAFRQGIRNPELGLPNGRDLDVWADYARAGLVDLTIDGYLVTYAPADSRWSSEEAQDWLSRRETIELSLFERIAKAGADRLAPYGVAPKDVEELHDLVKKRYAFLRRDVAHARSNMDVMADPNVLIVGRVPRA